MKYFNKLFILFFINFVLFFDYSYSETKNFAVETLKIDLQNELKKGNFLIGIKQYLGEKNIKRMNNNNLLFESNNDFLKLISANGISHKSKQIKIVWKEVPLQKPFIIERQVLGPFASYESAKKKSDSLNLVGLYPTIVYPNSWELWLPKNVLLAKKYQFKPQKVIYKSKVTPFLTSEYATQKLGGVISISSNENIKINSKLFGKDFYLVGDSYGTWSLIQKISFDKYLEGVLPHEIGANSPIEALKAQAVIARTWAFFNSERFKNDNYHLCITTQCQVYKPSFIKNNENIQKAILQTSGLILTYDKKPINAFYHASNGGIMASSNESWQMNQYPYFETKLDLINNNKFLPFKSTSQISNFLSNKELDFLGDNHYLFRWEKRISADAISELLKQNKSFKIKNRISDIKVLERGISGRATKLEISLGNTFSPIILLKDDIRRYLKFLPSNLFVIDKLNDNFWLFKGGGFGHGVGLSQSGAIEMAKIGFKYEDILSHYYSKTQIKNIKDLAK